MRTRVTAPISPQGLAPRAAVSHCARCGSWSPPSPQTVWRAASATALAFGGGQADRLLDPDGPLPASAMAVPISRCRKFGAVMGHSPHRGSVPPPPARRLARGEAVPHGGLLRPPGHTSASGHQLPACDPQLGEMVRHPLVMLRVHPPN